MKYYIFVVVGILTSLEIILPRILRISVADSTDVDECTKYSKLPGPYRAMTYYNASLQKCDKHVTKRGWYRFVKTAGRMMATNCVPKFHCGTYGTGWLDGDHPLPQDGRVMRRVCFHLEGECCKESTMIQVRNCGDFMVYHLKPPPKCPLRYCGDGYEEGATPAVLESTTVKEEATTVEVDAPTEKVHTPAPLIATIPEIPNECKHHSVLDSMDRAQGFYDPFVSLTDAGLSPGWYRFKDGAGVQMAEKCVKLFHCGTHATGWLKGGHPARSEGAVVREVCFHWLDDCCYFKKQIMVRRCDHFYVYEFPRMDISFLRYCGNASAVHNHLLKE